MDTWKSRCLSGIPRISSCRFLSKTISVNLVAVSSPNGFTIAFLKFMSQPIHLGNRLKARLRKSSGVKACPVTITLEKESILKSATPFPKCYLHKEKWTFDS